MASWSLRVNVMCVSYVCKFCVSCSLYDIVYVCVCVCNRRVTTEWKFNLSCQFVCLFSFLQLKFGVCAVRSQKRKTSRQKKYKKMLQVERETVFF